MLVLRLCCLPARSNARRPNARWSSSSFSPSATAHKHAALAAALEIEPQVGDDGVLGDGLEARVFID
jgi:hypothetical protein